MLRNFLAGIVFMGLVGAGCDGGKSNTDKLNSLNAESVQSKYYDSIVYSTDHLEIRKISDHVYEHTSFLHTNDFGNVPCNGMVVTDKNEAVVFDTPTDDKSSEELLNYFINDLHLQVNAVVPTHFHTDCLGGLKEFHQRGIQSYSNEETIGILRKMNSKIILPQNGFKDSLELKVGDTKVFACFLGEGHTRDNIVGYFPDEKILFGGCLLKESGAGKGNLEDANMTAWPETVKKVQDKFSESRIVIPGHGERGGKELFAYTIGLFSSAPSATK